MLRRLIPTVTAAQKGAARHVCQAVVLALTIFPGERSATAVNVAWSNPSDGAWYEPLNWSTGVVPQNWGTGDHFAVTIGNGAGVDLFNAIGGPTAIDSLNVAAGPWFPTSGNWALNVRTPLVVEGSSVVNNNGIRVANELRLNSGGTLDNQGTLQLASGRLSSFGDLLLRGGGNLVLAPGEVTVANPNPADSARAFTNVDNVIRGTGTLSAAWLQNEAAGQILADVAAAPLTITTTAARNEGLLRAQNGGVLQLVGNDWINQGGTISALVGGRVTFGGYYSSPTRIRGGFLGASSSDAHVELLAGTGGILDGSSHGSLALGGQIAAQPASLLWLVGTIDNHAQLEVRAAAADTYLHVGDGPNQSVFLQGAGQVRLSPPTNPTDAGRAMFYAAVPGNTLYNQAGHAIAGAGHLGFGTTRLVNRGTIHSDGSAGDTLYVWPQDTFDAPPARNEGAIRSTGATRLDISGRRDNAGGVIAARGVSNFELNYTRVAGGRIETDPLGRLQIPAGSYGSTLENLSVANRGTFVLQPGSGLTLRGSVDVDNSGVFLIDEFAGLALDAADVRLSGSGRLSIFGGAVQGQGNAHLRNEFGHTILGWGSIAGAHLTNAGDIVSNFPWTPLSIDASGVSVASTGAARWIAAGGKLRLANGLFQFYDHSAIHADDEDIELDNATIAGGDILTSNGQSVRNLSLARLDGGSLGPLRLSGNLVANAAATTHLTGQITLDGTLDLTADQAALVLDSDVLLSGQGRLALGAATVVSSSGPNRTLTLDAATLTGAGEILGSLHNAGVVRPGSSPGQLTIAADYHQAAAGQLVMELGGLVAGSEHDQLIVGGSATLSGTLQVQFVEGFVPTLGQTFDILQAGSRFGEFSTLAFPSGYGFDAIYTANGVRLALTSANPLLGDIDLDGDVDASDAAAFARHLGRATHAVWNTGDFNGDAMTSLADLALLQSNLGAAAAAAPPHIAIPEPATLSTAFIATAAWLLHRRMRKRHSCPRKCRRDQRAMGHSPALPYPALLIPR